MRKEYEQYFKGTGMQGLSEEEKRKVIKDVLSFNPIKAEGNEVHCNMNLDMLNTSRNDIAILLGLSIGARKRCEKILFLNGSNAKAKEKVDEYLVKLKKESESLGELDKKLENLDIDCGRAKLEEVLLDIQYKRLVPFNLLVKYSMKLSEEFMTR